MSPTNQRRIMAETTGCVQWWEVNVNCCCWCCSVQDLLPDRGPDIRDAGRHTSAVDGCRATHQQHETLSHGGRRRRTANQRSRCKYTETDTHTHTHTHTQRERERERDSGWKSHASKFRRFREIFRIFQDPCFRNFHRFFSFYCTLVITWEKCQSAAATSRESGLTDGRRS